MGWRVGIEPPQETVESRLESSEALRRGQVIVVTKEVLENRKNSPSKSKYPKTKDRAATQHDRRDFEGLGGVGFERKARDR